MHCCILKANMNRGIPHIGSSPFIISLAHSKHGQSKDTSSTLGNRAGHSKFGQRSTHKVGHSKQSTSMLANSAARRKHSRSKLGHRCHRSSLTRHGKWYASSVPHHGMQGKPLSHHSTSRVSSSQPMHRKTTPHQTGHQNHRHQCEFQLLSSSKLGHGNRSITP